MRFIWSEQKRIHISDDKGGKLCDINPKTIVNDCDPGPYVDVPAKDLNGTNLVCSRCFRVVCGFSDT